MKVVRMRWKSLRDSFVKETKHKMALSSGQDVKPRKDWRYSSAMSFLAPHLAISFPVPRKSLDLSLDKCETTKDDEMDSSYYADQNQSLDSSNTSNTSPHFLGALLDYSMRSQPCIREDDNEVDSFFRGLSDTVKKLNPINQIKIQRDIVNMVLGYRLKELQENFRPGEI